MAKKQDDEAVIIPYNERIPEIEREVSYWTTIVPRAKSFNETLYTRVKLENLKDPKAQRQWELQEINRCKNGYGGLSPKMYFWFHYCFTVDILSGQISPDYRQWQKEWFDFLTEQQASHEWGIVAVKRRRCGMSWLEAADVLHDVLFNRFYYVGMNSKTAEDSIILFNKVKFLFNNLPSFLRIRASASDTQNHLDFSYFIKDELGNKVKKGNQSEILVTSPVPKAFESKLLNKWVCDEAGKQDKVNEMFTLTEPCLMHNFTRVGLPVIFGTSGEVGKEGDGLRNFYKNADAYKLKRYFIAGYNGLIMDKFGNDDIENAIRWILYTRKRKEALGGKAYNDFIQQYPLNVEEAFSIPSSGGLGNIVKINEQLSSLRESPLTYEQKGRFLLNSDGQIIWRQYSDGPVRMWENVNPSAAYDAGCDPADHDGVTDEASNMSMIIRRRPEGTNPPQIVLEYTDRPQMAIDFYNQALLALLYYNKTMLLIERNRFRMIGHFTENGYKHLLHTTPQEVAKLVGGKVNTIGVNMTEDSFAYMEELIIEEIDQYCPFIPSEDLLLDCAHYNSEKKSDRVVAWGLALMAAKEMAIRARGKKNVSSKLAMPQLIRDSRGYIIRKAVGSLLN